MRLNHSIRPLFFAVPLLASVVLGATAQAGTASYVFNAAQRAAPELPLARVKVRLEGLPSDVAVTLNGTALSLPTFQNVANPNITGSPTDAVKATFSAGVLILDISTDSLIQSSPLKPCIISAAFGVGSVPYTIGLSSAGPVASTAYQITFYSSLSDNSSDDGCQTRTRRIPMPVPATLWSAPPAGTDLGRAPFDVVLVVDESGSMLSSAPGTATVFASKWALTVEAVKDFVTTLGAESSVHDRLALVFYDDTVRQINSKASGACGGLCWFDKTEFGQVITEISKPSPTHPHGGMTSIGGGLQAALPAASASVLSGNDAMIVLMSDGLQNTSPCLVQDAASLVTIAPTGPCPGSTPGPATVVSSKIPVLGITIGLPPGSASPLLLQALTDQTAKTDTKWALLGTYVSSSYGDTLVGMLKGNTLQMAGQTVTTLAAADTNGATIAAPLDKSIKRIVASLGWMPASSLAFALALQVKQPGAADWTTISSTSIGGAGDVSLTHVAAASTNQGSPFLIASAFDMTDALAGDWQFRAVRRSDHSGDVPYHLRVYTVEKSLDFRLHFAPGRHGTGQPLVLNADITFDGRPMTGIGNALQLVVEGPNGAIGTLLHDTPDPGSADGGVAEPAANAFEKKLTDLMASSDFVGKAGTKSTGQVLSLTEVGNGRYQIQLADTTVPGGYKFHFALDTVQSSGHVHRVEDITTQVEAIPDPKATTISVTPAGTGVFSVVVTPLDRFGNYVGPGFGHRVRVTLPPGQGNVAATVDPKSDGTYDVQLTNVPAGVDPVVTLSVNEVQIAQGPLSKLPDPGQRCRPTGGGGGGCAGCAGSTGGLICLPTAGLVLVGFRRRRRRG